MLAASTTWLREGTSLILPLMAYAIPFVYLKCMLYAGNVLYRMISLSIYQLSKRQPCTFIELQVCNYHPDRSELITLTVCLVLLHL